MTTNHDGKKIQTKIYETDWIHQVQVGNAAPGAQRLACGRLLPSPVW